jgi:hypothetical protein
VAPLIATIVGRFGSGERRLRTLHSRRRRRPRRLRRRAGRRRRHALGGGGGGCAVRVLRHVGGVHPGVHCRGAAPVLGALGVRALRRGRRRGGRQERRRPGGGARGRVQAVQRLREDAPRALPGRRRHRHHKKALRRDRVTEVAEQVSSAIAPTLNAVTVVIIGDSMELVADVRKS